jgi:hypothetical protein
MWDIRIRIGASAGLSVRREPKRPLPDEPEIRPGDLVVCDWATGGIQHTTRALDFTAPVPDGGWGVLSRTKKQERSPAVGVRAIEKEQGKRDNPGEPDAQAASGNAYAMNAAVGHRFISGQLPSKSMGTARPLSSIFSPAFVTPLRN